MRRSTILTERCEANSTTGRAAKAPLTRAGPRSPFRTSGAAPSPPALPPPGPALPPAEPWGSGPLPEQRRMRGARRRFAKRCPSWGEKKSAGRPGWAARRWVAAGPGAAILWQGPGGGGGAEGRGARGGRRGAAGRGGNMAPPAVRAPRPRRSAAQRSALGRSTPAAGRGCLRCGVWNSACKAPDPLCEHRGAGRASFSPVPQSWTLRTWARRCSAGLWPRVIALPLSQTWEPVGRWVCGLWRQISQSIWGLCSRRKPGHGEAAELILKGWDGD